MYEWVLTLFSRHSTKFISQDPQDIDDDVVPMNISLRTDEGDESMSISRRTDDGDSAMDGLASSTRSVTMTSVQ